MRNAVVTSIDAGFCCWSAVSSLAPAACLRISRQEVEERVLVALREKLMRRDVFEEFCREYVRELNRLRMAHRAGLSSAHTDLAAVQREIRKLVQPIKDGISALSIKDELLSKPGKQSCNHAWIPRRCRSCCTRVWPTSIARR